MLFEYNRCDAAECCCPSGRDVADEIADLEIIKCKYCGAKGAHAKCRIGDKEQSLVCENCVKNSNSIQAMGPRNSQSISNRVGGWENDNSTSAQNEQNQMRKSRLDSFFKKAQFDKKSPPITISLSRLKSRQNVIIIFLEV